MKGTAKATALWLPLSNPAQAWAVTAALLAVYLLTMSRDMSFFDSPELALVAVQLGLGHPPGQPLHTLLGWLLSHLPGVPPLIGLNLLSAVPGGLSVLPAISIGESLSGRGAGAAARKGSLSLYLIVALCGLQAALWEPATRIEVYALATFFALWALARLAAVLDGLGATPRGFLAIGVALGLSASANPYCALAAAAAMTPRLFTALLRRELPPRGLLLFGIGWAAGLSLYLYVFWAAQRQGGFVWGSPRDTASAFDYFSGADFRGRTLQASSWLVHAALWLGWSLERVMLPLTLIGLAGHLLLGRDRGLGRGCALWVYLLMVWLVASNSFFRPDVPDHLGYLALPVWLAAAGAGALMAEAAGRAWRGLYLVFAAVLALAALFAPPPLLLRARHLDRVTRLMGEGALGEAPDRAILLVASDHWVAPLLYLQLAEGRRPDLVILPYGLASSSWYWEQMYARHPDLSPIALRGPGGRTGRIRRFLRANSDRAVQLEDLALARTARIPACPGGWLLDGGGLCRERGSVNLRPMQQLAAQLALLGSGSPGTEAMIAAVAFSRGESLRGLGRFSAALQAYLAGVPPRLRPTAPLPNIGRPPDRDARFMRQLSPPVWLDPVALGDPARNLFMAGSLLRYGGKPRQAIGLISAAAGAGLQEAEIELKRLTRAPPADP